jgi:hypothetical protein
LGNPDLTNEGKKQPCLAKESENQELQKNIKSINGRFLKQFLRGLQ